MNSTQSVSLETIPTSQLKSVGSGRTKAFEIAGLKSILDILFYFPFKYLDRSNTIDSAQAFEYVENGYQGEITIIGRVYSSDIRYIRNKAILTVVLKDEKGFFDCVWFNGAKYFENRFKPNEIFAISEVPKISKYGKLQFFHPDFDLINDDESIKFFNTGKIIPFYSLPGVFKSKNLGDVSLRNIILSAVGTYSSQISETLPEVILKKRNLESLKTALLQIHNPETMEELVSAKSRFKYEEVFYLEILAALRNYKRRVREKGIRFKFRAEFINPFLKSLPFQLTKSQLIVLGEIKKDMESDFPLNRLLQGDVGSGKTLVALIAMLAVVDHGFQAVLMAPTEILAYQHFKTLTVILNSFNLTLAENKKINVAIVTGGQSKKERLKVLEQIKENRASIIVGTHALFELSVEFANPGLFVIDEQHRFGVAQRAKLIGKSIVPDVLIMTATPIPRTLSMTVYADLDVSVIRELPKNRLPIQTALRGESKLADVYKFIEEKVKTGNQVFIVYPLVEESEKIDLKAAEKEYHILKNEVFPDIKVGLLHGKMKWKEKEEIMNSFAAKEFSILVATTVVEVGIDIPDANIIIINEAFRFGLSQLHQLRGRVGRAGGQGYCILVAKDEFLSAVSRIRNKIDFLSPAQLEKHKSAVRLQTMVESCDGFRISEVDLKLRGPGDIFGVKQSGYPELKYTDLSLDYEIIMKAKEDAFEIIAEDPDLQFERNELILKNLNKRYLANLKYFDKI